MMRKSMAAAAFVTAGLLAAPAVPADTPSFTYAEINLHRSDLTGIPFASPSGYSWGAAGSFAVWNNIFVSGDFDRYKFSDRGFSADGNIYNVDGGYAVPFANAFAVYGKLGWAHETADFGDNSGYHAEVGARANVLSALELRASYGRYNLNGGLNDYAAAVQYNLAPMLGVNLGYDSLQGTGSGSGNINSWKLGVRWFW